MTTMICYETQGGGSSWIRGGGGVERFNELKEVMHQFMFYPSWLLQYNKFPKGNMIIMQENRFTHYNDNKLNAMLHPHTM